MARPSLSSWFDNPNIFGDEDRAWSSYLCSLTHSPISSSLLGPNILHSTLFSHSLRLLYCSSLAFLDVKTLVTPTNAQFYNLCNVDCRIGHLLCYQSLHNPKPRFLPQRERPSFTPIQPTTGQTTLLFISIFMLVTANRKTQDSAPNDSKHFLTSVYS